MSVQLDARYEYFSVGDAALLAAMMGVGEFSLCMWAYVTDVGKDHDLCTWGSHVATTLGWIWWRDDVASVSGRTNTMAGLTYPPEQRVEGATGWWNDTDWHHWIWTWKGGDSAGQKQYKDGVLGVNTGTTAGHTTITGYASTVIRFGDATPASSVNWLLGGMDDIRVYNRILLPNEATSIANRRGTDRIVNGLMARYLLMDKAPGLDMPATAGAIRDSGPYGYAATADAVAPPSYATYRESAVLSGLRRRAA